jgi:hypothetical protein
MVYYEMMEKHTIRELVEAAGREYRDHAVLRYLVDGEITDRPSVNLPGRAGASPLGWRKRAPKQVTLSGSP